MIFQLSDRRRDVIRIAPTISTYENQPSAGIDSYMGSDTPTTNYGTNTLIFLIRGGGGVRYRGLWKDSLTGLSNVEVLSANLSLWINSISSGTITVYSLLKNWVESQATHNIYSTGNNWTTAGAQSDGNDRDATPIATKVFSGSETGEQIFSLDVPTVQAWIDGTKSNYGVLLETTGASTEFKSSDHATAAQRPKLTIKYLQR